MKYIRTKDGKIIKFDTSDVEEEIAGIKYDILGFRLKTIMQFYGLKKEDIVKIADTIEELCDVIVCNEQLFYPLASNREGNEFNWEEINRFRTSVVMSEEEYNKIKETTDDFEPYFWKVFGAIWTDKGLIYVAKMNDEGKLELL